MRNKCGRRKQTGRCVCVCASFSFFFFFRSECACASLFLLRRCAFFFSCLKRGREATPGERRLPGDASRSTFFLSLHFSVVPF